MWRTLKKRTMLYQARGPRPQIVPRPCCASSVFPSLVTVPASPSEHGSLARPGLTLPPPSSPLPPSAAPSFPPSLPPHSQHFPQPHESEVGLPVAVVPSTI